ncbi:MAG: radical SAM protein [Deltaproteobacteria bacterium]|nr:radical SAM protein [Deltaproteobacteria bacterium]
MKVLLINPDFKAARSRARRYNRAWPPLDLLIAASMLRQAGHEVALIDARATGTGFEEIRRAARSADLVVLESSPLDRWQCPDLNWEGLVNLARRLPREKLVLAGAHGTVRPELMLRETRAAALIRGEPEAAIVELAEAGGNPRGIARLSYQDSGRIIQEPDQGQISLDLLPRPAYDLIDFKYYGYELLGRRLALLETSRGCPFSCIFCLKAMYGSGLRTKAWPRVLAEVEEVVGRYRAESVYFIDLEFGLKQEDTINLCQELIRMNLDFRWCCQTRADAVDPELLALMKEAGCALIHFGVETGSPRLLDETNKKISLNQIRTSLDHCHRLGMATACFFLFGLPGETEADRRATMRLARELNPTFASFHIASPYPGTELNRLAGEDDPFPACLSREHDLDLLSRQARRAFLSFYLRPAYVLARFREGTFKEKLRRMRLFWEFVQ